jgi:hypothetical protein
MGVSLHNHPIIPLAVPLAGGEGGDIHSWTLAPVLEVVGTVRDALLPEERNTWKGQNRRTDNRTPTYISQRWTKIATSVKECGDRW